MSGYADGSGNYDKDRRRAKIRQDKKRREKKHEKNNHRRVVHAKKDVYIDRDEELDFGWN